MFIRIFKSGLMNTISEGSASLSSSELNDRTVIEEKLKEAGCTLSDIFTVECGELFEFPGKVIIVTDKPNGEVHALPFSFEAHSVSSQATLERFFAATQYPILTAYNYNPKTGKPELPLTRSVIVNPEQFHIMEDHQDQAGFSWEEMWEPLTSLRPKRRTSIGEQLLVSGTSIDIWGQFINYMHEQDMPLEVSTISSNMYDFEIQKTPQP